MPALEKYFENRDKDKPAPKWVYGDRVSGRVGKVLVMGMVIREHYEDPSRVLCHLYLPIKVEGDYREIVYVPAKGMKRLKEIE
jgi:hypothetical protein